MNKPVSAKCYFRILSDLRQFSLILSRLRKYNCKNRGGVVRLVARRERHFPLYFHIHHVPLPPSRLRVTPSTLRIPRGKKSARKKFYRHFGKLPLRIVIDPHPSLFFSSQNPTLSPHPLHAR